jgi:hypothetical protein
MRIANAYGIGSETFTRKIAIIKSLSAPQALTSAGEGNGGYNHQVDRLSRDGFYALWLANSICPDRERIRLILIKLHRWLLCRNIYTWQYNKTLFLLGKIVDYRANIDLIGQRRKEGNNGGLTTNNYVTQGGYYLVALAASLLRRKAHCGPFDALTDAFFVHTL